MSNQQPQKAQSALTNPQVITAIIGGLVTLIAAILGVLPAMLNRAPEATAVIIVTATPLPPTATVLAGGVNTIVPSATLDINTINATSTAICATAVGNIFCLKPEDIYVTQTAMSAPTNAPATDVMIAASETPVPPTAVPTAEPMIVPTQALPSNVLLMYDDVSFTVLNQDNHSLSFANVTFRSERGSFDARAWGSSLPSGFCLRLRDAAVGQRQPPAQCGGNLYSLLEVSGSSIFWRGVDTFDVTRDGQVIATCAVASGQCLIGL